MGIEFTSLQIRWYGWRGNDDPHKVPLQWRHNEIDGVSNHRRLHYLLNCCFRYRSKKTSKLRVTDLCVGNSPVTGEFPAQKASTAENASNWWRHHDMFLILYHVRELKYLILFTLLYFLTTIKRNHKMLSCRLISTARLNHSRWDAMFMNTQKFRN